MHARHFAFAALLVGASTAQAVTVFADNFDADSLALNYTAFVNGWTVTNGTVDLIGTGFFDLYPGHGHYVDLDGSTGDAGVLTKTLTLTGGVTYTASFLLGGSQRGDTNTVDVMFGSTASTFVLASSDPLATRTLNFTPTTTGTYALSFSNEGGDNLGAILDNVSVDTTTAAAVPEPSAYALMLAGLVAVGRIARRRSTR
jgi:hypothetical protein